MSPSTDPILWYWLEIFEARWIRDGITQLESLANSEREG